jgi:hypothetical protein
MFGESRKLPDTGSVPYQVKRAGAHGEVTGTQQTATQSAQQCITYTTVIKIHTHFCCWISPTVCLGVTGLQLCLYSSEVLFPPLILHEQVRVSPGWIKLNFFDSTRRHIECIYSTTANFTLVTSNENVNNSSPEPSTRIVDALERSSDVVVTGLEHLKCSHVVSQNRFPHTFQM